MGCPQTSFLQMLNATTRYEVENGEYSLCLEKERNEVDVGAVMEKRKKKKKRMWIPQAAMAKGRKEAERQRMNHIAVERNRRKLMNSRLSVLHALLPSSLVQRNDQASIVAGTIDYIKSLEQLLISLQAKKTQHMKNNQLNLTTSSSSSDTDNNNDIAKAASTPILDFLISPQHVAYTESKCGIDVKATVVQGHVNLKIVGKRNQGQLVRAIGTLEEFRLSVMHLNITSLDASSVLYSLNLKVEEECKMKSADEIASLVHQIFNYLNTCCVD